MRLTTVVSCLVAGGFCGAALVEGLLSVPTDADNSNQRAQEIAAVAASIKNERRTLTIGGEVVPFYTGAVAPPGSLALKIRTAEATRILKYQTNLPSYMASIIIPRMSTIKTTSDVAALYELFTTRVERPMSADVSDETFGEERLTTKVVKLRQVRPAEYCEDQFQLSNTQLARICGRGVSWQNIRARRELYAEEFAEAARWNVPNAATSKYVPNVIGFFCYNRDSRKLLPIEIRFPDTGVAYSPLDTADEWTLAKMGLNAAVTSYQQWFHMADTHAIGSSVRVELYRHTASVHPVRALIEHHAASDFGLETLVTQVLLAPGTPLDQTFGWGALGSARFLDDVLLANISVANDFPTDLATRGLNDIPTHKYAIYGRKLYAAISTFVTCYVNTYYPTNGAIHDDFELQSWAAACAQVPHLRDFPARIHTKGQLVKLLSYLVYQSGVKHHAMNGWSTWHSMVPPYSSTALWKSMPARKLLPGETLNLMEYAVPLSKLVPAIGLAAMFHRDIPTELTLRMAYRAEPFASEPGLKNAIARFEAELDEIDALIASEEKDEKFPFEVLRPSVLPYYSWL